MSIEKVIVISLERTPERYATFKTMNPWLPHDVMRAVDGQSIDRERYISAGLITRDNRYSSGALGNLASHVALWKMCQANGRTIHVAEDDALFRRDFVETASSVLNTLKDWDLVVWGWNFDWPLKVRLAVGLGSAVLLCNQPELRAEWRAFFEGRRHPIAVGLIAAAGLPAYSLSPGGARLLLETCLPAGTTPAPFPTNPEKAWINTNFDVEMSRHYSKLAAYVSLPNLVATLNDHSISTIMKSPPPT